MAESDPSTPKIHQQQQPLYNGVQQAQQHHFHHQQYHQNHHQQQQQQSQFAPSIFRPQQIPNSISSIPQSQLPPQQRPLLMHNQIGAIGDHGITAKMKQLHVGTSIAATSSPVVTVNNSSNVVSAPNISPIVPNNISSNSLRTDISRSNILLHQPATGASSNNSSTSNHLGNQIVTNSHHMNNNINVVPMQQPTNTYYNNGDYSPNKTSLHSNRYPVQQRTVANPSPVQLQQNAQMNNRLPPQPVTNQFPQPVTNNRYPQAVTNTQYPVVTNNQYPTTGTVTSSFNKYWGAESVDLLQTPNVLPPHKVDAPRVLLGDEALNNANCSPDIFRCTLTKIPANNSLLQKSRLPLGVLIHPFKDLRSLPLIQCNVIVRCRACRTYINPFVYFTDSKRWKCNLCYRVNELPEEFQYDPVSKTYGDPSRRPEVRASTIEYIAPVEYTLRPPQPAVYLYLFDVSRFAVDSGYLHVACTVLLEELENLPGDARTQIGFLAYDSALHFFSLAEGLNQPHEMTVLDIEDAFLPTPDNLLVNLKDRYEMVKDLLQQLPKRYRESYDEGSAVGAALQVAYKMVGPTGGRVTVFQCSLPNRGPGALTSREDPNNRASVEVAHLNPANDFYKRLALECSGQQVAVDLFVLNSQYADIATISGISRFSGGVIHHFPLFKVTKQLSVEGFTSCLRRYLTRKIGFEAVMRVRCSRGLSIHTFHGNFFVRSTDLLSLPNTNPDSAFGMQVAIEENLSDVQNVCFQAALLYTSTKGERRIRVHTLCLPIASTVHEIIHSADQQCIVALLAKMAVDRSMQSSLSDAREAFLNVLIDILSSYKFSLNLGSAASGLLAPDCLKLLPLYVSALLKYPAFRAGTNTRLDDRVKAMIDMKCKPLCHLLQSVYPDLYPVHDLETREVFTNTENQSIPLPPRLQLSARCLNNQGAFLMDAGEHIFLLVCPNVNTQFLNEVLGVAEFNAIPETMYDIPVLDNESSARMQRFVGYLNDEKPYPATVHVVRDNSAMRVAFFERLIEDRMENALSYHEFLQHLKTQVK